jgi:hypothetical protein
MVSLSLILLLHERLLGGGDDRGFDATIPKDLALP